MELLQKYLFIPLDIFRKRPHNKDISNKADAWLTLFSSDDPDTIIALITAYPGFRKIYEEAYAICLNVERVMEMFSEELAILDRNTVKYMMDEMQSEMDGMQSKIGEMKDTIGEMEGTINKQTDELEKKQAVIDEMHEKYAIAIKNTVNILRGLRLPEPEIVDRLCEQFQMTEAQLQQYL